VQAQQIAAKQKRSKEELLEEYLLALILQSDMPKKALADAMEVLSEIMPKERAYHKIMDHLLTHFQKQEGFNSSVFGSDLPQELVSVYDTSFLVALPHFADEKHAEEEVKKIAGQLKRLYIQKRLKNLANEIQQKEKEGNEKEAESLQKQYSSLAGMLE